MEKALRALLLDAAALKTFVQRRVDWSLRPQVVALPAVTLNEKGGVVMMNLAAPSGWTRTRVQIDCWGRTPLAARDVAEAIGGTPGGLLVGLRTDRDGVRLRTFVVGRRSDSDSDDVGPLFRTMIYAKFKMVDAVVQAGMPNITCEIEGKDDILDVRTGERVYTRNAQLIYRDFMAMPREEGGFGCYPDELDDDWDAAQANVCDEPVALASGGTEPRYAFDSYITTGAAPSEVRGTFVTCCAGTFTYSGGKMLLRPGYYVPPSATLHEDDLAGPISVPALLSGDQVATEVTGTYINPLALYQPADAPTRAIDMDDVRQIALDMPHVTSGTMAQRVMEIALRKAQAERRVTWPMNIMGLSISTLDTVQLATSRYGLSNYSFQTVGWGLSQDFSVVLQLEEHGPEIFEWSPVMEIALGQGGELVRADPISDTARADIATSFPIGLSIVAAEDGSITISDHVRRYTDGHPDVAVAGAVVASGLAGGEAASLAYDDPERLGGAVVYQIHADPYDARVSPDHLGRHYVGFAAIPAPGSPPSDGGGAVPPGGEVPRMQER